MDLTPRNNVIEIDNLTEHSVKISVKSKMVGPIAKKNHLFDFEVVVYI